MDMDGWIVVAVIIISIVSSVWKALHKQRPITAQPIAPTVEDEDEMPEEDVVEPASSVPTSSPRPKKKAPKQPTEKTTPAEEANPDPDLEIDLTDADEARRAFIASEIFNKKY